MSPTFSVAPRRSDPDVGHQVATLQAGAVATSAHPTFYNTLASSTPSGEPSPVQGSQPVWAS